MPQSPVREISRAENRACGEQLTIDLTREYDGLKPRTHLKWARGVARGIANHYRFHHGSQEQNDLEAIAYLTLARLVREFDFSRVPEGGDPQGQFRGWVHPFIRGECQREARRLRNGGTYNTRRETGLEPVMVEDLPRRRSECGTEEYIDVPDRGGDCDAEGGERAALAKELAAELLGTLDPSESLCLRLRRGIGCEPHGYGAVAEALCVTKDQAKAIEAAAIAKLRAARAGEVTSDPPPLTALPPCATA